ncbi:MAG: heme o synthase [Candidatus Neomarinimicrobiota bacterium]
MRRIPKKASSLKGAYFELTKPSITFLILISTALGYYLGGDGIGDYGKFLITIFGSCLVSSGAGSLNHFAEMESDWLMDRTKKRPLPAGIIEPDHARLFGLFLTFLGTGILYIYINPLTSILALVTTLLYLFVYTPLKKMTWLNTSIGAIPGAIPPLGGWAASEGKLDPEAWVLFAILFLWQHPHFYAIALMYRDDYAKANLKMLPVIEPDGKRTNRQILWHAMLLIPVSLVPVYMHTLGMVYFYGALSLGLGYLMSGFLLIRNFSMDNARLLLQMSVIYLPALFLIILMDKIL